MSVRHAAAGRRGRPWVTATTVAVLASVLLGGHRAWAAYEHRSPYGPSAVHARLTLTSVETGAAQPLLDRLTGGHQLTPTWTGGAHSPQLVGQLTFDVPANAPAHGFLAFFLVDERRGGRPTPDLYGWAKGGADIASGWNSFFDQVPRRYAELAGLAALPVDGGWTDPGMSLLLDARTAGPVTIDAAPGPQAVPGEDLSVFSGVLAFFGPDQHLYWATRVPVAQSR